MHSSVTRPILVDTFCGIGGAAKGYVDAGFDVVGIDHLNQPRYPYTFIEGNALDFLEHMAAGKDWRGINPTDVRAIHASPPCHAYSTLNNRHKSTASPMLIEPIRCILQLLGKHLGISWVIESVEGAKTHMENPLRLHGGMFGLRIYRPRLFETNAVLAAPPRGGRPINPVSIYGRYEDGRVLRTRVDGSTLVAASLADAQEAMEMPWADWAGIKDAVPPRYTEWIGRQLLETWGDAPMPTLADRVRALVCPFCLKDESNYSAHADCWHLAKAADILETRDA